jgi:hypothetical protein
MADIVDDMGRLVELLGSADREMQSEVIDVRITSEHLVLLIGRMIPAINTVAADLYMTVVSEIESGQVRHIVPASVTFLRDELGHLRKRWDALENRNVDDDLKSTEAILDFALIVAELNVVCLQALDGLLRSRF